MSPKISIDNVSATRAIAPASSAPAYSFQAEIPVEYELLGRTGTSTAFLLFQHFPFSASGRPGCYAARYDTWDTPPNPDGSEDYTLAEFDWPAWDWTRHHYVWNGFGPAFWITNVSASAKLTISLPD
jgi:hypothetical protein